MLEITMDDSSKFLLERAGIKNVISFCIFLSYGNIKNIENKDNKTVGKATISIQEQIKKIENNETKKVRIWYSSLDNEEVCTLYFLVSYFYERNIEILICDTADSAHYSLIAYKDEDIPSLALNSTAILLDDKKKYRAIWEKLVQEDSDLRVRDNNKIISVSFNYLDSKILDILKKYEKIKYWSLISECMLEKLCGFYLDIYFISREDELIKNNFIEVCEIKKEKNKFGEYKEQIYVRICKSF